MFGAKIFLVQQTFLEQKYESSGLIVTLIGDDYIYRGDFYHDSRGEQHVEWEFYTLNYIQIINLKL